MPIGTYLHWLPIKYRIEYKIAVIVHSVIIVQELCDLAVGSMLRAVIYALQKDRTNLVFTDRSFSQAAPTVWKNLP